MARGSDTHVYWKRSYIVFPNTKADTPQLCAEDTAENQQAVNGSAVRNAAPLCCRSRNNHV